MLYRAGFSKLYHAIMVVAVLVFLYVTFALRSILPPPMEYIMAGVFLAIMVALVLALLSGKPRISVTEQGILYQPRWFPLIEWQDIAAVILVPRVVRSPRRTTSYLRERWRPIMLFVRPVEKYITRVPKLARIGLEDPNHPKSVRIEIQFMGLDGDAREFYRVVKEQLEKRGITGVHFEE